MNADQKANIEAIIWAIGQSLAAAWSSFHLLRGLDIGSRQSPEVVQRFGLLYDRMWRAIFDGFFAKVGTVIDNTKNTHSLPNLITLIERYGTADLKQLIPDVKQSLTDKDSSLAKLKNWRHHAVAHRPASRRDLDFYAENKMTLTEVEEALSQLDDLFNHLSLNILAIHNDTRSGTEALVEDGKSFLASAAIGLRGHTGEQSIG